MCVLSLANRQNLNDMEAEIKNIVNLLGWHLYLCSNFLFDWQYMRRVVPYSVVWFPFKM